MMPTASIQVVLTLADGEVLARDYKMVSYKHGRAYTYKDAEEYERLMELLEEKPWVQNRRKRWDNPQDPLTLTATIEAGHEAEVREAMGLV